MSLNLLLDENLSQVIAEQVRKRLPSTVVESVHLWREGAYKGRHDRTLLKAAAEEKLTLITFDLKTIPGLLKDLYKKGVDHAGIVFIDERTMQNNDFGTLTRAIVLLVENYSSEDWENRVYFLKKPPID